ncbi:uncharacterized protein LOC123532272 [Mercenaria mercenaria]|uniref:uncharacterized protein LOC123532272 n=1 Tax=Mercenaria mercenaria TaxID=6596 RepID=UPI001E1D8E03|nr:uncharacterized protein LOC123532272 [Mercenaria mercenaria]
MANHLLREKKTTAKKLPPIVFSSLKKDSLKLWRKVKDVRPAMDQTDSDNLENLERRSAKRSIASGVSRKPNIMKMRMEVDKLWESSQLLMKKEGDLKEDDIEKLRRIIKEAVDMSSRIRVLIREKDTYTDEDVVSHAKDINNLQLFLHNVVEIWTKVDDYLKEKYSQKVMAEMMELATDVTSVYGEVMSIFLQRFGLDIVPLLRPVHGLFYSISIHCRYHCPDLAEDDVNEMKSLYSSFLAAMLNFMKSTKVLLKRLRFDTDVIAQRRRLVQSNISAIIEVMHSMIKDGRMCSAAEYVDTIERIGSLCTDIFFVVGKTSGIAEQLELGEGVIALEPAEVLGEICHSDVMRCPIEQRPVVLKNLELDDGSSFITDVFVQTGSTFNPTQKVTMRMPFSGAAFPPGAVIKVKLKIGDEWYDTPGIIVEEMIEFKTKYMQAFVATIEYMALMKELTPAGYCYICPEDDRVRLNFPDDCVSKLTSLAFKLIQINRDRMFDYKEQCPNLCRNILAISDIIKVYHDESVVFMKPIMVHLPIPNDIDDPESEIVIFQSRDDGELELIPKRTAMLCPSTQNCYTFQVQSFSGIAIGKVKKKNLRKNRAAVIEEYELYVEDAFICNILTFLDKSLLHVGLVKVFVEVVERRFAKKALRRRSKEGLFEVPGSRSPSIRLKNEDIICIEMEGNIQRMKEIPLQNYFIVFLSSARDNYRTFSVEPRKDPENRAYGLLNYYQDSEEDQPFLHSAHIDANKYMIGHLDRAKSTPNTARGQGVMTPRSLGGSWTSRPATRSARESVKYRAVFDEVPVLSHQSILSLCSYLKIETVQNVAYELGVPYDDVMEAKCSGEPPVMINYNILWKWRGNKPAREKVQHLINAFRICGYSHIGEKIMNAGNQKRALTKEEFK